MSTISILETSTGEAVILQEIKRVVDERNDLRRRLENANILIEHLEAEKAEMLEALEWLSNEFDCRDDEYGMVGFTHDEFRKVESAIRKARGEE